MKWIKLFSLLLIFSSCSLLKKQPTELFMVVDHQHFTTSDNKEVLKVKIVSSATADHRDITFNPFEYSIEGFTYNAGFTYVLKVRETKISRKEQGTDGKEYRYELIEVVSKNLHLTQEGIYVKIQTNMGDIYGRLAYEEAPLTVANFVALAEGKMPNTAKAQGIPYYDGIIFHRVIPNFMIQGGDPQGMGSGGPGYKFRNETTKDLSHKKGTFSMANSGPNTNGSQFFITHRATPWLDGGYNVFGYVIAGQDVVDAIGGVPRNKMDRPNSPVTMQKVSILRIGESANQFDALSTFNRLK